MEQLLFRNVICKGYLKKQETKYVYPSDIEDEYIEDDVSITLNQGGECEQGIYKFIEKKFEGICVGIFFKKINRKFVDCFNDIHRTTIFTHKPNKTYTSSKSILWKQ